MLSLLQHLVQAYSWKDYQITIVQCLMKWKAISQISITLSLLEKGVPTNFLSLCDFVKISPHPETCDYRLTTTLPFWFFQFISQVDGVTMIPKIFLNTKGSYIYLWNFDRFVELPSIPLRCIRAEKRMRCKNVLVVSFQPILHCTQKAYITHFLNTLQFFSVSYTCHFRPHSNWMHPHAFTQECICAEELWWFNWAHHAQCSQWNTFGFQF